MAIARRLVTVVAVLDLAVLGGGAIAAGVKDDGGSSSAKAPSPAPATGATAPTSVAASSAPASSVTPSAVASTAAPAPSAAPSTSAAPASTAAATATVGPPPIGSVSVGTRAPATHTTSAKPKPTAGATSVHVSGPGAVPGTYAETSTGTITVGGGKQDAGGTATLVVDKAQGTDQRQSTKSDQSSTEQLVRFGADGSVKLLFTHIANQAFDESFHFATPEPILPARPAPGMTYSWTATSDSGKTTIAYTGTVKGTEDLTIGGTVVHCIVVHSTFKLTGATNVNVDQTDDYAPAYKLIVREHQIAAGKYSVISYTADITTTLVRLTPQ